MPPTGFSVIASDHLAILLSQPSYRKCSSSTSARIGCRAPTLQVLERATDWELKRVKPQTYPYLLLPTRVFPRDHFSHVSYSRDTPRALGRSKFVPRCLKAVVFVTNESAGHYHSLFPFGLAYWVLIFFTSLYSKLCCVFQDQTLQLLCTETIMCQ
jgi:hypothetical protein